MLIFFFTNADSRAVLTTKYDKSECRRNPLYIPCLKHHTGFILIRLKDLDSGVRVIQHHSCLL